LAAPSRSTTCFTCESSSVISSSSLPKSLPEPPNEQSSNADVCWAAASWGYTSAFVSYALLCHFFPAKGTLLDAPIYEDSDIISAASFDKDTGSDHNGVGGDDKKVSEVKEGELA
jgi:hypothetical protein